jgi:hypothetical protein
MVSGLPVAQIDFARLHERVCEELRGALISGKFSPVKNSPPLLTMLPRKVAAFR